MEYIYAAMFLHSVGKQITEEAVTAIFDATGVKLDVFRVKALVAALTEIDIDEALKVPIFAVAAPAAAAAPAANAEEKPAAAAPKKEEKEEDLQGLGALFR